MHHLPRSIFSWPCTHHTTYDGPARLTMHQVPLTCRWLSLIVACITAVPRCKACFDDVTLCKICLYVGTEWHQPYHAPTIPRTNHATYHGMKVARVAEASPSLRVSEDKTQIGRKEPMTEEGSDERMARTVQVPCVWCSMCCVRCVLLCVLCFVCSALGAVLNVLCSM